jgi:hypothetical protein
MAARNEPIEILPFDMRTPTRFLRPGDWALYASTRVTTSRCVQVYGISVDTKTYNPTIRVNDIEQKRLRIAYPRSLRVPYILPSMPPGTCKSRTLAEAKRYAAKSTPLWVIDRQTLELVRVATAYDLWVLRDSALPIFRAVREELAIGDAHSAWERRAQLLAERKPYA